MIENFTLQKYASLEFQKPEEIAQTQFKLLQEQIAYCGEYSPFYRDFFAEKGINPKSIQSLHDFAQIGCTTKSDLLKRNEDFMACPEKDVVDICFTSATTGDKPTIIYQNSTDLSRLAYNEAAAFKMAGITSEDTLFVCAALDRCFMAGLAYYLGGISMGARMVRAGSGSATQHWHMLKATSATVLVGVPSLIRKIGKYAQSIGEDPAKAGIKKMIAIGEPVRDHQLNIQPQAALTEAMWNAPFYSTYASTEMATAFCECSEQKGGHIRPELIVAEILDESGKPVTPGNSGEITITPLGLRAMPLIRFRTGDISFFITDTCDCGRNTMRLAPVLGRKNQMLKFKGTTVFPSSIISIVDGMNGVIGAYVEAMSHPDGTDRVILNVATNSDISTTIIAERVKALIRVVPEINLVTEKKFNEKVTHKQKRKKIHFFDLRK